MKNASLSDLDLVVDFSSHSELSGWNAVDDVVMGGVSTSRIGPTTAGTAQFEGQLSLANGGGFASVRSKDYRRDLDGVEALSALVRGDGRTYQLRLHSSRSIDGVTYRAHFETAPDTWHVVRFLTSDFVPTWRGQVLRGVPEISFADVLGFGLMVSGEQAGEFALELAWIAKALHSE